MAADGSLVFDTGIDSSGFTKGLSGLITAAGADAAAVTAAFTGAAAAAVSVGSAFTSPMSQVAATMGITSAAEDYALLSAAAKEMGATTKYSASQAAEALNYLALAGYDAQQSVSALPTVLNLAAEQMAETMSDNLEGDMLAMQSALEAVGVSAFEKFENPLRSAVQAVTSSLADLNLEISDGELSESLDKISEGIGSLISKVGEFAADTALPFVINSMELIIDHGGTIISVAAGIALAVKGMQLVPVMTAAVNVFQQAQVSIALLSMELGSSGVTATALGGGLTVAETAAALFTGKITIATAAQAAFNAVASINPFYKVVAAVTVVVTALGLLINHINKSKTALSETAEETNEYVKAMDKVKEANEDNIKNSNEEIGVIREKADRYEELRQRYEI